METPSGSLPLQSPSYDWSRFLSETRKRHHYPRREITSHPELLLVSDALGQMKGNRPSAFKRHGILEINVYLTVQFSSFTQSAY